MKMTRNAKATVYSPNLEQKKNGHLEQMNESNLLLRINVRLSNHENFQILLARKVAIKIRKQNDIFEK